MSESKRKENTMTRIDRIREMERRMDEASEALRALGYALDAYDAMLPDLRELAAYYGSSEWRRDFEADEAGLLPPDLKRGVLSEDALYDLLAAHDAIRQRMRETAE